MNAPSGLLNPSNARSARPASRLVMLVPFILGAALHLSTVFRFFSPLPIVFAHLRLGRVWGIFCSVTNLAIVWLLLGRMDAAWFFVMAVIFGSTMAECFKLKLKLEVNVLITMAMMIFAITCLFLSYAHKQNIGPVQLIERTISQEVDLFVSNAEKYKEVAPNSSKEIDMVMMDPQMAKKSVLEMAPSFVLIALLLLTVANLLLVLRFNFNGVRENNGIRSDFFSYWKTPDHLVWPTLASAFCLIVEIPYLSGVALTALRFLMAIYCIQGFAILKHLFDGWKMKGFLRIASYVLALTFLMPVVVALGFFDLWFSFREKFGATHS